jgi:hypothetical protein
MIGDTLIVLGSNLIGLSIFLAAWDYAQTAAVERRAPGAFISAIRRVA